MMVKSKVAMGEGRASSKNGYLGGLIGGTTVFSGRVYLLRREFLPQVEV